ncbi:PTS sugar transporter subunit IIA [Maledivibacter halophilus]|uniref:PTS system IIA component, Fru family n=1 Tax=Maledivibacter halophilus TaxID=36842 RepID=A0A1T5IB54_9FIRM|nr:PTS sugar transporter subunit IIA [Maledivibacter halophilus]SKC36387.1 PTS system IIA component, Fru family [Maledivibacter halophilus]
MKISNLTNENLINLQLKGKDKIEIIKELASLMEKENKLISSAQYLQDVYKREDEYSTAFERGIAIPHGKSHGVRESCIAIGKCNKVKWSHEDNCPVEIVILMAVPKDKANDEHLAILSKLAEMLMEDEFIEELKKAATSNEVLNMLKNIN